MTISERNCGSILNRMGCSNKRVVLLALFFTGVLLLLLFAGCAPDGFVTVNEVCTSNGVSFRTEAGFHPDWIELHNPSNRELRMDGYIITDKPDSFDLACVLSDIVIPAGGYAVIPVGETEEGVFSLPFGLSRKGEDLYLLSPSGKLLQKIVIPALDTDVSFARRTDGTYGYCAYPTPGKENGNEIVEEYTVSGGFEHSDIPIAITEIAASSTGHFEENDWIELHNTSNQTVKYAGLFLTDDVTSLKKAIIHDVEIPPDGYLAVPCVPGKDVDIGISSDGDEIWLLDGYGRLVSHVTIPALYCGQTWALAEDGIFGYCGIPTPGEKNRGEIGSESLVKQATGAALRLSEVLFENTYSITDCDGDHPDFVELYNAGSEPIDLGGYFLTDDFTVPCKYSMAKKMLQPGQYHVVFLSGKESRNGEEHAPFAIGEGDDGIMLYCAATRTVQTIAFKQGAGANVSVGLGQNGELLYYAYPTPWMENARSVTALDQLMSAVMQEVHINEVSAGGKAGEWVELCNGSGQEVNLDGWTLTDHPDRNNCCSLNGSVPSGGYMVVVPNAFGISIAGETLLLYDAAGNLRDHFATGDLSGNVTSGRVADSAERVYFRSATKGADNQSTFVTGRASSPVFSVTGLYHDAPFLLEIRCVDPQAAVHYTLDGTEPNKNSAMYEGPIEVSESMTVRAISYKEGALPGKTVSASYVIGSRHTLPVVCIGCDPSAFRGYMRAKVPGRFSETKASIAFYEADGTLGTAFQAAIKPRGNMSIKYPQKSLTIHLRGEYGQGTVNYPFWGDGTGAEYGTLVLRNGSQDYPKARMRDSFAITAARRAGLNVDCSQTTPVVVYVNGNYYGLMDLNEGTNQDYLEAHYGIDPKTVNQISTNSTARCGTAEDFLRVRKYARTKDFTKDSTVEEFSRWVDIDCVADYLIAQTFFGNYDVHNQLYWATKDHSLRWRPIFYDIDRCFTDNTSNYELFGWYFSKKGVTYGEGSVVNMDIYYALRQNKAWSQAFLERYAQLLSTDFSVERLQALVDEKAEMIRPEMAAHIQLYHAPSSMQEWEKAVSSLKKQIALRHASIQKQLCREFGMKEKDWKALMQQYAA